jgi:uncharacterized glyoxalase superfamily protein PhnB
VPAEFGLKELLKLAIMQNSNQLLAARTSSVPLPRIGFMAVAAICGGNGGVSGAAWDLATLGATPHPAAFSVTVKGGRRMERAIPNLPADDLQKAKAFYVGQLGFTITYEATEDGTNGVMGLQRGGFLLHLDAPMSGHGRNVVVTLEVDDADALFEQWRDATYIERSPRDEEWGGRTFGVADPFGNLLYVVGPPKS